MIIMSGEINNPGFVPFDENGNLLTCCFKFTKSKIVWIPIATQFDGVMTCVGLTYGGNWMLKDKQDQQFPMFPREMARMITQVEINRGVVNGRWGFMKSGQRHGLRYVGKSKS